MAEGEPQEIDFDLAAPQPFTQHQIDDLLNMVTPSPENVFSSPQSELPQHTFMGNPMWFEWYPSPSPAVAYLQTASWSPTGDQNMFQWQSANSPDTSYLQTGQPLYSAGQDDPIDSAADTGMNLTPSRVGCFFIEVCGECVPLGYMTLRRTSLTKLDWNPFMNAFLKDPRLQTMKLSGGLEKGFVALFKTTYTKQQLEKRKQIPIGSSQLASSATQEASNGDA